MYTIYWIINNEYTKTYTGITNDLIRRIQEHKRGLTKSTKNLNFSKVFRIEEVNTLEEARIREKYWKSNAGRKKLKNIFNKIKQSEVV